MRSSTPPRPPRDPNLEVELAGQAIENAQPQKSSNSTGLGVILALIVLGLAFGALLRRDHPDRDRAGRDRHRLRVHRPAQPRVRHRQLRADPRGADRPRRRHRLRLVHRHPPPQRRYGPGEASRTRRSTRSTPPGGRCFSPASPWPSHCSASSRSACRSSMALAVAATVTVALTMLASLTLLPALLGFIGLKVLSRRRTPTDSATRAPQAEAVSSGLWYRWSRCIERHTALAGRGRPAGRASSSPSRCSRSDSVSTDAGTDPAVDDDPAGVRPAGQGIRPRVQRAIRAGRGDPRVPPTRPPSHGSSKPRPTSQAS